MLSYAEFILETIDTISLAEDFEGNQSVSVCVDSKFYIQDVEEYHTIKDEMMSDYKNVYWYLLYAQYVKEYAESKYNMQEKIRRKQFKKFMDKYKNTIELLNDFTLKIKTNKGDIISPGLVNIKAEFYNMLNDDEYWLWYNLFDKYNNK